MTAGEQAILVEKDRPEGYFWKAANMGALAESFGLRQGIKYRGEIKRALETVLRLDPSFQHGSADRALGRWYLKVPGLFGGSRKKSEEHLRKSLTYNPNSHSSRFFLAETLFAMDRDAEAISELQKILAAPIDPDWGPEDREFKEKARARLDVERGKDRDAAEVLRATPDRLRALVNRATSDEIRWTTSPARWSIAEIAAHLADSEIVGAWRIRSVLARDGIGLQAYDQNVWASAFRYDQTDAAESVALFEVLRRSTLRVGPRVKLPTPNSPTPKAIFGRWLGGGSWDLGVR